MQSDRILHETCRDLRRDLIRSMSYEQLLKLTRMKAHQQIDLFPRDIRVSVPLTWRHPHEVSSI